MAWTDESVKRMMKKDEEKNWQHFQSLRSSKLGLDVTVEINYTTDKKRYKIHRNDGSAYIRYNSEDAF